MRYSVSATLFGSKALVLPARHLTPLNLPAFVKNIEYDTTVLVYKVTEILHHPGFDIPRVVREVSVDLESRSSPKTVQTPNEDLPDDYLEMLSSKFPYSEMLPKVHHH